MEQMTNIIDYGWEYTGPQSRLGITPLTERAHLTLANALSSMQCGTLAGNHCTGKTATIQDYASMMGRNCQILNCSEMVTSDLVCRQIQATISSGSWVLFDHVDSFSTSMLHMIGEALTAVLKAIRLLKMSTMTAYERQIMNQRRPRNRANSITSLHSHSIAKGQDDFQWKKELDERNHSLTSEENGIASIKQNLVFSVQGRETPPMTPASFAIKKEPIRIGHISAFGMLVPVNRNAAFFTTVSGRGRNAIPDVLNINMRPCSFIEPHTQTIIQSLMLTAGFIGHKELSERLNFLWDSLRVMLPDKLNLPLLKTVLACCSRRLHDRIGPTAHMVHSKSQSSKPSLTSSLATSPDPAKSPSSPSFDLNDISMREEYSVVYGVFTILTQYLGSPSSSFMMKQVLRDVFPQSSGLILKISSESDSALVTAIQEQLATDGLQPHKNHIQKVSIGKN